MKKVYAYSSADKTCYIQGDITVVKPSIWYSVPARNESDEAELVNTYVGVPVQNLWLRQEQVTSPVAITAVAWELCVYWHVFCANAACFYTVERYL
jgi:hypothetical protein